jgi:hypothetical protein
MAPNPTKGWVWPADLFSFESSGIREVLYFIIGKEPTLVLGFFLNLSFFVSFFVFENSNWNSNFRNLNERIFTGY